AAPRPLPGAPPAAPYDRVPVTPPAPARAAMPPAAPPALERPRPAPAAPAAVAPRRPMPEESDDSALSDSVLARVAPALRAQLHDTLEKMAWEAFGSVAESIVEQAVERLEKVAWEVVPRLAETLILEEIRKLKGGDSEDAS